MWNEITRWWTQNHFELTWFIIGWLAFATLDALLRGDWVWAAVDAFLLWANYKLRKVI
jgi:hypothetical protein